MGRKTRERSLSGCLRSGETCARHGGGSAFPFHGKGQMRGDSVLLPGGGRGGSETRRTLLLTTELQARDDSAHLSLPASAVPPVLTLCPLPRAPCVSGAVITNNQCCLLSTNPGMADTEKRAEIRIFIEAEEELKVKRNADERSVVFLAGPLSDSELCPPNGVPGRGRRLEEKGSLSSGK